jgi:hypothetical protein
MYGRVKEPPRFEASGPESQEGGREKEGHKGRLEEDRPCVSTAVKQS